MKLPLGLLVMALAAVADLADAVGSVAAVDTFEPPYTPSVYCEEKMWVWGNYFDRASHPTWNFTLSIFNRTGCGSRCAIGDPGVRLIETLQTDWPSADYTWVVDVPDNQDFYFHVWDGIRTPANGSVDGVHLSFPIPAWTTPTTRPCDQSRLRLPFDAASVRLTAGPSAGAGMASLRLGVLSGAIAALFGIIGFWG